MEALQQVRENNREMNEEGIIEPDTEFAKEIGFTSDKFVGISYLWKIKEYVYISCIKSINPGQGNLTSHFNAIQQKGFSIKVPSPFPLMESICKQKGFKKTLERNDIHNVGDVEVWVLKK